jgi:hypothetical protein
MQEKMNDWWRMPWALKEQVLRPNPYVHEEEEEFKKSDNINWSVFESLKNFI